MSNPDSPSPVAPSREEKQIQHKCCGHKHVSRFGDATCQCGAVGFYEADHAVAAPLDDVKKGDQILIGGDSLKETPQNLTALSREEAICSSTHDYGVTHRCIHRAGHSGPHTSGSASWQERRCRHCGEEIRRDGDGDWIDCETHTTCDTEAALKHEPEGPRSSTTLQARIDYLEGVALPHARKQEHANGFQVGWHAALERISQGDAIDELRDLVPSPSLAAVSRDTRTENDQIEQRFKTKYGYESPNLDAYIEGILEERMQFWERLQASEQHVEKSVCVWTYEVSDNGDSWEGSCGAKWEFLTEGPAENNMRFCPECGGKVVGSDTVSDAKPADATRRSAAPESSSSNSITRLKTDQG
jgi:hypothetical protein